MIFKFRLAIGFTLLLAWVLLIPLSAWAKSGDLVVERAWLEDSSGQVSWQNVGQQPMKPFTGVLSAGYGSAPIWLRIRIDPKAQGLAPGDSVYMRIRPTHLDEVVLFDPAQSPSQRLPVGDLYPISNQDTPSTTFVYILPAGERPRDLFLRVKATTTRLIYVEVMPPDQYRSSAKKLEYWTSFFLALIVVFALLGGIQLAIRPDQLIFGFLGYQCTSLLLGICMWGYAYLYLSELMPPGSLDLLTNLVVVLSTGISFAFSYVLMKELAPPRWSRLIFKTMLTIYPILLLGLLSGYVGLALRINMLTILLFPWVVLLLAFLSPREVIAAEQEDTARAPRPAVLVYFVISVASVMFISLPGLSIAAGSVLSIYSLFIYSSATGLMMLLILQFRFWKAVEQRSRLRAMASEAQAQADRERSFREDRERLLAMLGHELKTPLATMQMLLARDEMVGDVSRRLQNSVADMTQVVSRTVELGRVDSGMVSLVEESFALLPMLSQLVSELPEASRIVLSGPEERQLIVRTDPDLLKTILRNLLDNALKYSPSQSQVRISVSPIDSAGHWKVAISNTPGRAGMPDPKHIFQKYYRSPKATYRSGTGLGLYLVQGLAKAMGGDLVYGSESGEVRFVLIMGLKGAGEFSA